MYSLRVVPPNAHRSALLTFDSGVRNCLDSLLSASLGESEWELATLATSLGGLGLRSTEMHSPAAFFASHAACNELCSKVDPQFTWTVNDSISDVHAALSSCNSRTRSESQVSPDSSERPSQKQLSKAIDACTLARLKVTKQNDTRFLAHLNHTSASGANQWLHALFSEALGLHT